MLFGLVMKKSSVDGNYTRAQMSKLEVTLCQMEIISSEKDAHKAAKPIFSLRW